MSENGADARPVGRPSEYKPEFCELAANMCAAGATDFEVAQALEVHVSTLYRWKASHPEFCDALKVGKELADDRVEASLFHRAVGYSHPAVKIFQNGAVIPYTEHVAPDPNAAKLWLTNRKPQAWREKSSHEHTGPNGESLPAPQQTVYVIGKSEAEEIRKELNERV